MKYQASQNRGKLTHACPVCSRDTDTSICADCASLLADIVPEGIDLMPAPDAFVTAEQAVKIRKLIRPQEPLHEWEHTPYAADFYAGGQSREESWVCKNCKLTITSEPEDDEWRLELGQNSCGTRQVKMVMES